MYIEQTDSIPEKAQALEIDSATTFFLAVDTSTDRSFANQAVPSTKLLHRRLDGKHQDVAMGALPRMMTGNLSAIVSRQVERHGSHCVEVPITQMLAP